MSTDTVTRCVFVKPKRRGWICSFSRGSELFAIFLSSPPPPSDQHDSRRRLNKNRVLFSRTNGIVIETATTTRA